MKNLAKLVVLSAFGLFCIVLLLSMNSGKAAVLAGVMPTPPPANAANTGANTANKVAPAPAPAAAAANVVSSGRPIPKTFTLGTDSLDSEKGEVAFDHESHAFKPYTPDGKSVMGCVECHHTDQPKSALKPPLKTSERSETLTLALWQSSSIKVTHCRDCHFQTGNVPDGKEMPKATYDEGGKSVTKTLDNQLAFHINCNSCHDAAAKVRPELLKKPGFAIGKDCMRCHKPIS
jgi:predicted CXXCH cytochrome family protein